MPSIYRVDASIRLDGSVSRAVADTLESALMAELNGADVIRRDVGLTPLPATAWAGAVFGPYVPAEQRTPEQAEGLALARQLADELQAADAVIFAVPLYNFGVSQHFKAYVDLLLTEPRFAPGATPAVAGRPAQLIITRGGGYGPGTPRHGWDHATAWYRRMLADVLKLDLEIVEVELTLADVTPAMEALRGAAAENLANAHSTAQTQARALARRLADSTVLDLAVGAR
ncbi:ACP phosphodiesterase [Devosia soli]|uniref:ACP phosphodiesterase n=1 Tax=Devosia soli TaxID=361041 RepID=A0A0F5LD62_9HYPH|nr:NAD(P)H-dependent oxidoreductase [Devosia soli]KKB80124.1 ACP phosphodiesterase [Devosia soli]